MHKLGIYCANNFILLQKAYFLREYKIGAMSVVVQGKCQVLMFSDYVSS
jgi:hypothetical protein